MGQQKRSQARIIEFARAGGGLSRDELVKRKPTTELGHRIVSATVEEFAAKGVQGARVSEIARRAGTTDPTFYRYFHGLRRAALFVMSEYYWAPLNLRLEHYRQITDEPRRLFEPPCPRSSGPPTTTRSARGSPSRRCFRSWWQRAAIRCYCPTLRLMASTSGFLRQAYSGDCEQ